MIGLVLAGVVFAITVLVLDVMDKRDRRREAERTAGFQPLSERLESTGDDE